MATAWKKALIWLGLGTDEDYEAYDQERAYADNSGAGPGSRAPQPPGPPNQHPGPAPVPDSPVRPVPQPASGPGSPAPRSRSASVRPIPPASNAPPLVVAPVAFNDAQQVADTFKGKQPVIVNLQNAQRDLSRRLIDFSSGLCYGLGGRMEKVADHVYLLTPSDVQVSAEERRRWEHSDPTSG